MNTPKAKQSESSATMPHFPPVRGTEREITINSTNIHIKSVFTGQTSFDDALSKIINRKVADTKN